MVKHLSFQAGKGIYQSDLSSQLVYSYIKSILVLPIAVIDDNRPDAFQHSRSSEHFAPISILVITLLLHKELIWSLRS